MLDRAKVALFDRLGARLAMPGRLPAVPLLDLYAGAGTLGIECLSRGATWACFVENEAAALRALRENLAALASESEYRVVPADAATAAIHSPPHGRYGLIFLDPPYRMTEQFGPGDPVVAQIESLGTHEAVADDALLIFRQDAGAEPLPALRGWRPVDRHRVGTMALTILARARA
jgi:16S rRNA (guanine966-N2)-methyltransferase